MANASLEFTKKRAMQALGKLDELSTERTALKKEAQMLHQLIQGNNQKEEKKEAAFLADCGSQISRHMCQRLLNTRDFLNKTIRKEAKQLARTIEVS